MVTREPDQDAKGHCQDWHHIDIAINGRAFLAEFRFGGRLPFEKALAGYKPPHQRARDSIKGEKRLVCEECERQQDREIGGKQISECIACYAEFSCNDGSRESEAEFYPGWHKK